MLFPDKATIYLAAIEDGDYRAEKIDCAWRARPGPPCLSGAGGRGGRAAPLLAPPSSRLPPPSSLILARSSPVWDRVYGFDFSCIKKLALREPLVDTVDARALVTEPAAVKVGAERVEHSYRASASLTRAAPASDAAWSDGVGT